MVLKFIVVIGIAFIAWFFGFQHGAKCQRDLWSDDCFYCHECILCKRDLDASYCRSKKVYCVKCANRTPTHRKKAGYMGDVNGAGCDPSTV